MNRCRGNTWTISFANKADEPISQATITTSWADVHELKDINPPQIVDVTYRVGSGAYRVEVVFQSGKHLDSTAVYATSGFDYKDQVTVTPTAIELNSIAVKPQ